MYGRALDELPLCTPELPLSLPTLQQSSPCIHTHTHNRNRLTGKKWVASQLLSWVLSREVVQFPSKVFKGIDLVTVLLVGVLSPS